MKMHQHPEGNSLLSSRPAFPPEMQLFRRGTNIPRDSGLVLSTDCKPRIKWTPELHAHFMEAVNQLGGADKATPKTVMRLMGIPGLTLYHLKSHLQKYRLHKKIQVQNNDGTAKNIIGYTRAMSPTSEVSGSSISSMSNEAQPNKNMQTTEALQVQIEVQRYLHEQIEVQRHLQLRIEAQGKYLQSVLDKAQETLLKQKLGSKGLEAVKALSEVAPAVSDECLGSAFSGLQEHSIFCTLQTETDQHADSMEMRNDEDSEQLRDATRSGWVPSYMVKDSDRKFLHDQRDNSILPMVTGNQNEICTTPKRRIRETHNKPYLEQPNAVCNEREKQSDGFGPKCFKGQLDLNVPLL